MAQAGWYQGSVWFVVAGKKSNKETPHIMSTPGLANRRQCCEPVALMNYRWADAGMVRPVDDLVAALVVLLCLGSAVHYTKTGDAPTAGVLVVIGSLQTYAAFF
jgi:hypothetical protein